MAVIETDSRLARFLDLIGFSEGTSTSPVTKNDGYDVLVSSTSGPAAFTDYSNHPFLNRPAAVVRLVPRIVSTAAGRYQVLEHYFAVYKEQLSLPDFSPLSQDKVALQQIKERKATQLILDGKIQAAIEACSNIWASFPGNDYGQGGKSIETLLAHYGTP